MFALVLTALLAFFVSSSRLTALGAARKAALDADFKGASGRRAADQALATAGVPALLALLHAFAVQNSSVTSSWFRVSSQHAPALAAALLAYLACANGDTWASELGMLDPDDPLLVVLPFKAVPPGTNGAVSWLGTGCSVLGGCLVGAAFALAAAACAAAFPATPAGASAAAATASLPSPRLALALGACAGLVGSFIDSLLGATVRYRLFEIFYFLMHSCSGAVQRRRRRHGQDVQQAAAAREAAAVGPASQNRGLRPLFKRPCEPAVCLGHCGSRVLCNILLWAALMVKRVHDTVR